MNEQLYYDKIIGILKNRDNKIDFNFISLHKLENYYTIKFFDITLFRIIITKRKGDYLEVSPALNNILKKTNIEYTLSSNESVWNRITIGPIIDFEYLSNLFYSAYEQSLCNIDFSCCSRYLECSNAGYCVHQDTIFSGGCSYRVNLNNGKIFYGKVPQ